MGNIEITTKFSRLKSVSSIDDYLETTTEVFYKKSCSQKFCNIYRKTIVLESFFNKVAEVYWKEIPTLAFSFAC